MHSYATLAVLVLAASAVSPAVSAPVHDHDRARQDARDLNLSNVLESRAHGVIGEQLRRELETLNVRKFSIGKGGLGKLGTALDVLSIASLGLSLLPSANNKRSTATHTTREEVDLVLRQIGRRSISPIDLSTSLSLLSKRDSLVDAITQLGKYYERDLSEGLSEAIKAFSRTLDELD
ncbi:hypothetical protein BJV78DRAFT_760169 [Lactifluus subvellereus]|nr:hypothetical protein BJV78DRAFT_760169 [Lactifluus subvellereus]